jgi:hypothetical protein
MSSGQDGQVLPNHAPDFNRSIFSNTGAIMPLYDPSGSSESLLTGSTAPFAE